MARKDKIKNFRGISRKRTKIRLWKKAKTDVKIKEIPRDQIDSSGVYSYVLYMKDKHYCERDNIRFSNELKEFLKSALSGKYKIHYANNNWTKSKWITSVKIEDETDLFTIMLCHSDMFRKIRKLKDEKEPA